MRELSLITENLQSTLIEQIDEATEIYIAVAFVQPSGLRLLMPAFQRAVQRGATIHFLIGDYLYITSPDALDMLLQQLPEAETRLFMSNGRSFHPKAYLFRFSDGTHSVIGSSNVSKSALTTGVEWNVSVRLNEGDPFFEEANEQFFKLFLHEQTVPLQPYTLEDYRKQYEIKAIQLSLSDPLDDSVTEQTMKGKNEAIYDPSATYDIITPRPAQQIALKQLEEMLEDEYDKALVVLATGLGKTYLAAFFSKHFQRVLFIAHREELLIQAKRSFLTVEPDADAAIFNGTVKEVGERFTFASIFTLASPHHLHSFEPDAFDLIVIDEFHHATAPTYERVLHYFEPTFLLGITATPERLDNKDVYALCDGNVAASIHFIDAIRNEWLAPFVYYGIRDPIDYDYISWRNKRYDEQQLLQEQLKDQYALAAYDAWYEHKQTKSLGFCSSVVQANFMSEFFKSKGVAALALHGESPPLERRTAIEQLERGELDIIFTVNLFNEGVDIPSVDTLLFARPTESLTVFTQQIGRGLRLFPSKSHCVIIDLIGNYKNATTKLAVFQQTERELVTFSPSEFDLPEHCSIHFETEVVDILRKMNEMKSPRKQRAIESFLTLQRELGRRPTYLEFHLHGSADSKIVHQDFQSYPNFLYNADVLTLEERHVVETYREWFIEVNKTRMAKSYKMVVLLAMLQRGPKKWREPITAEEIAPFFHEYVMGKEYRKKADFSDRIGKKLQQYDEKKMATHIRNNPFHYWAKSAPSFITWNASYFSFHFPIAEEHETIVYEWTKDICLYRLHTYFERKANS